ncbi:MAG: hypothetical protein ACK56N_13210 [Betaproteobacteria bacterium]|jgi:hypothetical protein
MQKERSSTPLNSDSPAASGSDRSAGDRDDLCRRLLVVLARTQAAPGAAPDAELAQLHRCVQAALFILDCDVPWTQGERDLAQWWAGQSDEYAESQIVQDLLWSGLTGIALGRLQPAVLVYRWLRTAMRDARDIDLVWGVALLGAQRFSEARACFSQLDDRDELTQALMAASLLNSAPADAVEQLKRVQACCLQPPIRDLVREILETFDHGGQAADRVESELAAWSD